ncbi:hypothetical protein [Streptomyces smaragdinus]|uniref:hypothetical protein n=1 Tax=Streptomyces smaragdinus TaxID=2585196 RepID=UPI001294CFEB|nr:hypothetical protein [Streptomyces smaragdinus]
MRHKSHPQNKYHFCKKGYKLRMKVLRQCVNTPERGRITEGVTDVVHAICRLLELLLPSTGAHRTPPLTVRQLEARLQRERRRAAVLATMGQVAR